MAISKNNSRLSLLHHEFADSDTETVNCSSSDFSQLPDYVLHAASLGWRLLPTPGRRWVEGIGVEDATDDLRQLSQWARELSGFNWSVATGAASGVLALEGEAPHGLTSLRRLHQLDWPQTLHARSPNYMVAFWRYPVGTRAVEAGRLEIAPGLAVRADGESVVLPTHDGGDWLHPDVPFLEAPEWLIDAAFAPAEPACAMRERCGLTLIQGGLYRRGRRPRQ